MAACFSSPLLRRKLPLFALILWVAPAFCFPLAASPKGQPRHGRGSFLHDLPKTVRPDHPAIVPVADAIRQVTRDPLEQLTVVHHVTHLLVDYDSDRRVYQRTEYHATLDEMIAQRRAHGWTRLRDDCDGRAVFAAHLLAALDIPWRLEVSFWKKHAWVSARINGTRYDLLDLRPSDPELQTASYRLLGRFLTRPSHPPPSFQWRTAWYARTGANVETGVTLGLLAADSRPGRFRERFAVNWTRIEPAEDERRHIAEMSAAPKEESKG